MTGRGVDAVIAVGVIALGAIGVGVVVGACGVEGEAPAGAVGTLAPDFGAVTLEGDSLDLGELQGEAVLVNIWATWCPPCREEMPGLDALHERFIEDGFRIVAVSIDSHRAARDVREFVEAYGLGFTVLLDPHQRVTRAFRSVGVPESILLDREGRVTRRWVGAIDPLSEEVVASVRAALGDP